VRQLQRSAQKASKKGIKWLKDKPFLLISLGLFIFFVGASHYYQLRVLSFTSPPPESKITKNTDIPAEIIIPSINIDLPIDEASIKDGVWQISYTNATFLGTSESPGSGGNTVIYGHNKKLIFGNLPYLSLGQKILIKTKSGKVFTYLAYEKDFVSPDRVDLVSPSDHEELTIFTCYGLFDSQRVVVKAKPIL
jgi:LPXTG-site transpeptidase (sortase) family protein